MNENVELCSKLLIIWSLNQEQEEVMFNPEYEKASFIAKILRKKFEVFKINVKIPDPLIMLIEICTESNPGISQLMLKEILTTASRRCRDFTVEKEYVITPDDFSLTYPREFPIINNSPASPEGLPPFLRDEWNRCHSTTSSWEEHFSKNWGAQKDEKGRNKCDTPEWWRDFS